MLLITTVYNFAFFKNIHLQKCIHFVIFFYLSKIFVWFYKFKRNNFILLLTHAIIQEHSFNLRFVTLYFACYLVSVIIALHYLAPPTVKSHWFKKVILILLLNIKYVLIVYDLTSLRCFCFNEERNITPDQVWRVSGGLWVNYGLGLAV